MKNLSRFFFLQIPSSSFAIIYLLFIFLTYVIICKHEHEHEHEKFLEF